MNAKVEIQLPKQLIPFYSAVDVLKAYSLASEAAVQIRTLVNQISKSTAQIKAYVQKDSFNEAVFSEIENLISISNFLLINQLDVYSIECKKLTEEPYDKYDAGDLFNVYYLTYENMSWLQTLLYQIKDEAETIKQEADKHGIHPAVFANLERLIQITEYLADDKANSYNIDCEKYEIEWKSMGGDKND